MGEVVGGHCNAHSVTRQNADVMAAHAAGQLGANEGATLIHLDGVLATAEGILDTALHLQQIAFAHACVLVLSLAQVGREAGTPPEVSQQMSDFHGIDGHFIGFWGSSG
jgi:hypothetical protein